MSKKLQVRQERIYVDFLKELDEITQKRITNQVEDGKSVKKLTYAEYTRMILNADNWMKTKEELSTKPREIDVY